MSASSSHRRRIAVAIAVCSVWAAEAGRAQSLALARGADLPAWLERWSPLTERADLPRRLPGVSTAVPRLTWPAPAPGLFWQGGNPAGLVDDVRERRMDGWGAGGRQSGQFRRPLDPDATSLSQLSALAWQPLGTRGAGAGRVTFDRETIDPGTESNINEPFGSSPFITTDTSTTPVRRTRARLEAAGGWRVGRYRLGAALGYDTRDQATLDAGFVRRGRRVMPGATLGVARPLGAAVSAPRLGVHVGWRGSAETVLLIERAAEGRVHQLVGYRDVRPIDVNSYYYRRIEVSEPTVGVQVAGAWRDARWLVFADGARHGQRLWREEANDPAADRWKADAWGAGFVLQRAFGDGRWLVTGSGELRLLTGDADLATDSAGIVFAADERTTRGEVEVRWTPAGPWRTLVAVGLSGEARRRQDVQTPFVSDLSTRSPSLVAEGAWTASARFELLAGVAVGRYQARGEIPGATRRGQVFRRLLAPDLQLQATESTPWALTVSGRWRVRDGVTVWALARSERLSGATLSTSLSSASNHRSARSVMVGITR